MDFRKHTTTFAAAAIVVALLPALASADMILSFAYGELDGSYDSSAGQFTAMASAGDLDSSGTVARNVPTLGTANFDYGFYDPSGFANFELSLTVTSVNQFTALGSGTLTITDADGDTITGSMNGRWVNGAITHQATKFSGDLYDVYLNGTEFNGTDGGSFLMDFSPPYGEEPYDGFVVSLGTDVWFQTGDFTGHNTSASGQAFAEPIPVPGAVALGLIGLGLVGRRRNG